MIDKLVDLVNDIVKQSGASYAANGPKYNHDRWKYCVALAARGWKAYDFEYVPTEADDDVIIMWRKEGEDDIKLRLSFTEQCKWLKYLEQKEKKNGRL